MSVWNLEHFEIVHQHFHGQPSPAFDSAEMQERVWGRQWGITNDTGRLRTVLLHRPGDEMLTVDDQYRLPDVPALVHPERKWYFWGESSPDLAQMQREHDALTDVLRANDVEIVWLDDPRPDDINAMFTRDMMISVPGGAIIGRMGPLMRRGQELNVLRTLARIGMPVLHTVHGTGLFEGGSYAMLNETTAVCSIDHRDNEEGADQVEQVLNRLGIELLRVQGRGWSCHIDGELVMVDHDTALIAPHKLPYWFLEKLKDLGIRAIDVHPSEDQFATNCLVLAPGKLIIADDCPHTAERLQAAGIEPILIPFSECHKNGGGLHCASMPLFRE